MTARRLRTGLLALAALLILGLFGQSLLRVRETKQEVQSLERDLSALRQESDRLGTDVERLRSDPDRIEREAREGLGLVKPGEKVLKLPPTPGG